MMPAGIKKGETLRGPPWVKRSKLLVIVWMPPIPAPTATPALKDSASSIFNPESLIASCAAIMPNWVNGSIFRASLAERWASTSKFLTFAQIFVE